MAELERVLTVSEFHEWITYFRMQMPEQENLLDNPDALVATFMRGA